MKKLALVFAFLLASCGHPRTITFEEEHLGIDRASVIDVCKSHGRAWSANAAAWSYEGESISIPETFIYRNIGFVILCEDNSEVFVR